MKSKNEKLGREEVVKKNLTDDCNYSECSQIEKPTFFQGDDEISVLFNEIKTRNYELKQRMCRKTKEKRFFPSEQQIDNLKTIKIFAELPPWFDINHSPDFYGRQCQYPCERTKNLEDAEIVVANTGSADYGGEIENVKNLKNLNKTVAFIGFEPYGEPNKLKIIDKLRELADYFISHVPFSEIGVSDSLNYRIYGANNLGLPESILFAFNKMNKPTDPQVLARYKQKLVENFRNQKNKQSIASNFVSNCNSKIRTSYINILESIFPIHNYGRGTCFKNRQNKANYITPSIEKLIPEMFEQKRYIQQFYFFAISFENDILPGYYTEKLVDGLENKFSIPVYLGAPEIKDLWFSNIPEKYHDKIMLFANEYNSPKELAKKMIEIKENEELYLEYFQWRLDGYSLSYGTDPKISGAYDDDISWFCRLCEYHRFGKRVCRNKNYDKKYMATGFL